MAEIHTTYASEKVNKIRWRPDTFSESHNFVTGSWDNQENAITLWDFQVGEEFDEIFPFPLKRVPFAGDVTELLVLNSSQFLASSTCGSVTLYDITTNMTDEINIGTRAEWKHIHRFRVDSHTPASCSAMAVNASADIATVGEDGRINLLSIARPDTVISSTGNDSDDEDACCVSCAGFVKYHELLTVNERGLMQVWDVRTERPRSVCSFPLHDNRIVRAAALTFHPTQQYLAVVGDDEGAITVWDLRNNSAALSQLNAHSDAVAEIRFHPDRPDQMFSCTVSGDLWQWSSPSSGAIGGRAALGPSSWSQTVATVDKMEVDILMPKCHKPLNSIDLSGGKLLCASDNEVIYLIDQLNIYK